jgi:hypothetical protein
LVIVTTAASTSVAEATSDGSSTQAEAAPGRPTVMISASFSGLCFIHLESMTVKIFAIDPGNCSQGLIPVLHFDKGKSPGFEGVVICDDFNWTHVAKCRKFPLQFLLGGLEW